MRIVCWTLLIAKACWDGRGGLLTQETAESAVLVVTLLVDAQEEFAGMPWLVINVSLVCHVQDFEKSNLICKSPHHPVEGLFSIIIHTRCCNAGFALVLYVSSQPSTLKIKPALGNED